MRGVDDIIWWYNACLAYSIPVPHKIEIEYVGMKIDKQIHLKPKL